MAEESRFAVFDFEEDLLLDPIDIFDHEELELLKAPDIGTHYKVLPPPPPPPPCAAVEPPLAPVASAPIVVVVEPGALAPTGHEAALGVPSPNDPSLLISDKLQHCVQTMSPTPRAPNANMAPPCAPSSSDSSLVISDNLQHGVPTMSLAPNEDVMVSSVPSRNEPPMLISKKLQYCVQTMSSKVEQLQREALQATRAHTILKQAKEQRNILFRDRDAGSVVNKKPRLFDAARTEAVKRKKISDLLRLCGSILRQLTQHKWAWPFMQPVDVEGLQLHDYYKIIRRPMDLGTIRSRFEAKDGSGYRNVREFCEDVRLVFRNAMLYNESWTEVHLMAKTLLQKFEDKWKNSIEPRLAEEEERLYEDQQNSYLLDIAELHASEEQAAEQLRMNVVSQLTDVESKLDNFLMQTLSKCRTMGVQEKKDLYLRLSKLPPSSFTRVVEIVRAKNDPDHATDDIAVDLEALDSSTLWRLHFYSKMIMDNAEEQAKKPLDLKIDSGGPSNAL